MKVDINNPYVDDGGIDVVLQLCPAEDVPHRLPSLCPLCRGPQHTAVLVACSQENKEGQTILREQSHDQ